MAIDQQPTGYLDTDQLMQASMDTAISSDNVGYRLLLKMGWGGKGLGRNGEGVLSIPAFLRRDGLIIFGYQ